MVRIGDIDFWHSAQGGKEIYQLQIPSGTRVPNNWTKQGSTKVH
jgi:DNA mismatch repair protein MSH6